LRHLTESVEQISQITQHNEFSINALSYRNPNERIAAKFLTEALNLSKNGLFKDALAKIDEAKNIVPNYFETYRVSAFIKATDNDLLGADEDYKTGLEIEPNNLRLLFYYSQFLLFQIEDINTAFEYAQKVYSLRPKNSYTAFLIARCFNALHQYDEAIEVVKNLVNSYLSQKDLRIAYTDMIRYYNNKFNHKHRIENDFNGAFECFKKSMAIFESSCKSRNFDFKVIKAFAETLYIYVSSIPLTILSSHFEYAKKALIEYDSQICLTPLREKIILKFFDRYNITSIDGIDFGSDLSSSSVKRYKGHIARNESLNTAPYVFIKWVNGQLYANKNSFIDISNWVDWKDLVDGQLVEFEIGENHQGKCAANVKLL
jgi:LuxR family transcriptional regulator, glucitol operon activator